MTCYIRTTLIAAAATLALTTASAFAQNYPSDFAALDADNNSQVSFAEYSAVVKTSGMTTTAAAQQFTRISAGDAIITEEELNLAIAFQDQPYALQNINGGSDISYVAAAPEFEPQVSDVKDSPVMDAEPIVVEEAPAPEVEIIREPVPETAEPTVTTTEHEVTLKPMSPEIPETDDVDIEDTDPEDSGDILLENEVEPLPEG